MIKCRACLTTEMNMIPMDASFLENFNLLTGLSITKTKALYICKKCSDTVNFYIDFRNTCIESDLRFQELIIQEIMHENENLLVNNDCISTVKQEMKLELYNNSIIHETQNRTDVADTYVTAISKKKQFSDTKVVTHKRSKLCLNVNKSKAEVKYTDSKVHCGLCDSKLDDRIELSKHLEYHKSLFNAQVTCGLCTERFLNLPHMLGHRLEHIPEDQRICHLCSKKFLASSSTCLEFHYMRVHDMAEKDAQIQCKQCASSYVTSRKLIRHVRDCHSAPRYECRICSKGFRNKTLLNVHNKMKHTDEKHVKCKLCPFTSKYPNSLTLHTRRKHTPNTFNCKACYRVFLDESSLTRHVADVCKHHARVVCPVCGHTVKKVWLKHHMRSHSDEYPFKCATCPAQYKYRTGLKDHTDKHKGAMAFHCDLCSKKFSVKSALQSHRRTHADAEEYYCTGSENEAGSPCSPIAGAPYERVTSPHLVAPRGEADAAPEPSPSRSAARPVRSTRSKLPLRYEDYETDFSLMAHHALPGDPCTYEEAMSCADGHHWQSAMQCDKPFVCDICKVGFKRRYNLKAHIKAHPWTSNKEEK